MIWVSKLWLKYSFDSLISIVSTLIYIVSGRLRERLKKKKWDFPLRGGPDFPHKKTTTKKHGLKTLDLA